MSTILCLDDFTCGLAEAAQVLRENGCRVLTADDNASAVQVATETHLTEGRWEPSMSVMIP